MYNLKDESYQGPNGVSANFIFRKNTADECTCQATFREDEYHFVNFPPKPGDFMIDGGGYIGTTAILYAKLFPQCKVITIEPLPENVSLIRQNIERNGLQDRIFVEPKALFSVDGEKVEIYYRDESPVGVAHKFIGTSSRVYTESVGSKFFSADTICLKTLVEKYKIGNIRMLKMDMECGEYKALENVPEDILKKIQTIEGEYHNPDKTIIKDPRTKLYNQVKNVFDDKSPDPETQFIGHFLFERKNI